MFQIKKKLLKIEEKSLIIISLIMFWGAAVYYLYELNWLGIGLSIILSFLTYYLQSKFIKKTEIIESEESYLKPKYWLIIIYLLLAGGLITILLLNTSDAALISPWKITPAYFFSLYFITTLWLFIVLNNNQNKTSNLWLIRCHYFLSFSVAVIIYQIGYGFDPFIHQATMELIARDGYVLPKTPYYLGQYSLIVIIHKLSGISIYLLNKFLVPVLAALFLPQALINFIKSYGKNKKSYLVALSLLALPFNIFILSTPQNLSYLWLILIVIYSLLKNNYFLTISLTLATISIHPLSGLPALFFIIYQQLEIIKNKFTKPWWTVSQIILWLLSALSLPLAFASVTGESWRKLSISVSGLLQNLDFTQRDTNIAGAILNFPYLLSNNWIIIFLLLSISGFIICFKNDQKNLKKLIKLISSLVLGFLLSASLNFSFLIDYEQNDYILRLIIIIIIFSLPAIIISTDYLIYLIKQQNLFIKVAALITISSLITASLYLSYPRLDAYTNSRGYSLSEADIQAVRSISANSKEPYIALANQQTSVAALKELGFKNYFTVGAEQIFFYPIPTGGKLYQYYLKMVNEKPDRATIKEAADLVGVKEAYFVINKYWNLSNKIVAEAKINADTYWTINNGDIYVFYFNFN